MSLSYHPCRCAEHAAIAKARATRYLVITPAASCHLVITLPKPLRSPPTSPLTPRLRLAERATLCCKVTAACKCGWSKKGYQGPKLFKAHKVRCSRGAAPELLG